MNAALKKAMANSLARRANTNYASLELARKEKMNPSLTLSSVAAAPSNGAKAAATVPSLDYGWSKVARNQHAMGGVTGALKADEKATGEPLRGGAKKRRQTGKRRRSLRNKRRSSRKQRKQQKKQKH